MAEPRPMRIGVQGSASLDGTLSVEVVTVHAAGVDVVHEVRPVGDGVHLPQDRGREEVEASHGHVSAVIEKRVERLFGVCPVDEHEVSLRRGE